MAFLSATYNRVKQVRILIGLLMIEIEVTAFGRTTIVHFRTLNWNKRHKPLKSNRGWSAPRDKTRKAPRLSNGRWVPINSSVGDISDWR